MSDSRFNLAEVDAYLRQARWFGGKGRGHTLTSITPIELTPDLVVAIVDLRYDDGSSETYQLPLARTMGSGPVITGEWYDATHDPVAMAEFLRRFATADVGPSFGFHRLPGPDLDVTAPARAFAGEQSNTTVMFGEQAAFKVFRKLADRTETRENPDIEIHRALTRAGCPYVAQLLGWLDATSDEMSLQLGVLQEFLRDARDGWRLALDHARADSDFTPLAHDLGVAVRGVHEALLAAFGEVQLDSATLADSLLERLSATVEAVGELAQYQDRLQQLFASLGDAGPVRATRVHGDLHLGQTLLTSDGWKIVDFEGEPAKPLAERVLPDSPWRDVAGMLRSFDYAACSVAKDDPEASERLLTAAAANRTAFLEGYLGDDPLTPTDQNLLNVYEADKAAYEVLYEARNRPTWVDIPLNALQRVAGGHR